MTLAITDANIFIDLIEIELLSTFFQLDLNICTTKEVILECDENQRAQLQEYIDKQLLTVQIISDEDAIEIQLMNFKKGLSEQDKSILFIAKKKNGMVITGDKLIRKWCKQNNIKVHGILWALEEMNETQLLNIQEAINKLEMLLQINFWLPIDVANKMLEKWRGQR